MSDLWRRCLQRLEGELGEQVLHTWLQPLQAREDGSALRLFAPNTYALDRVRGEYLPS
ncbi:MAG: DnaA N-terminal domain-containing protein, partial [Rhodanobacteraceae bacterium]